MDRSKLHISFENIKNVQILFHKEIGIMRGFFSVFHFQFLFFGWLKSEREYEGHPIRDPAHEALRPAQFVHPSGREQVEHWRCRTWSVSSTPTPRDWRSSSRTSES